MTAPPSDRDEAPLVFLIAGEPSGDQLGGRLMTALLEETRGRIRFAGVGGEAMEARGLESLVPMERLSVMGLTEIVPHIPRILRTIREVAAEARAARPAALVTIDAPAFSLRVSRRLAGTGIPLIHYVAPSVWAWRPGRAKRLAAFLDHLLALLPFEPPYFERHGLPTSFVGHPAVEAAQDAPSREAARHALGLPPETPVLCLLPGSRQSEAARLLPIFRETVARLRARFPELATIVPTVGTVASRVEADIAAWPGSNRVVRGREAKLQAFAGADCALAASGTVAVELAVARLPAVIAYRVSPASAFLARRLIKVRYASLANLLLDREAQPEFLQERCTPENLAAALETLLTDPQARAAQMAAADQAVAALTPEGEMPSRRAARTILSLITPSQGPGAR